MVSIVLLKPFCAIAVKKDCTLLVGIFKLNCAIIVSFNG
jgi:hypothetical protein